MSIGTVALIAAFETVPDADGALAAGRAFAGATVLEHQARRALRAGATRLVVLAEAPHPTLTAIVQRLRRDALPTELATSISDAADRIHPDEPVLIVADGVLAPEHEIARVAAATPPALLTVADLPGRDLFERIDASVRWAGVALLQGQLLRDTAEMVGEWDPLSVLLRRAVQIGAARIAMEEGAEESLPIIAHAPQGLVGMERRLVAATRGQGRDWPSRLIFPYVEEPLLPALFRRQVDPWWLAVGAAAMSILAVVLSGYLLPAALGLLVLSGPTASIGRRLQAIRAAGLRHGKWFTRVRVAGAALTLVGVGRVLSWGGQWGWWLLPAAAIAAMAAYRMEKRALRQVEPGAGAPWLASTDGLIWAMLPFGIVGQWGAGLAAVTLYAAASFAWTQRRLLERLEA